MHYLYLNFSICYHCRTWGAQLWPCATSWQVMGFIPDGVIGIFLWHNTSGCTQPLAEMITRGIEGLCIQLTVLPLSCADCHEIWKPQPPVILRACPGLCKDCCTFTFAVMEWCLIKHRYKFTFIRNICLEFGFMICFVCLNITWMHLCDL
jgi:hypothetical protein